MTLQEAVLSLRQVGIASARLDAELLLSHVLGCDRAALYARDATPLSDECSERFAMLLRRRTTHEPLAYLVGHKEFYGHGFVVNSHVLIPRPETELLVEQALRVLPEDALSTVIDVGTGSGCVGISIALARPHARVWATDLSKEALQVAKRNAANWGVSARMEFVQGDLLEPLMHAGLSQQVDCLVSNPPYIQAEELAHLEPDVRLHEPRSALVGEGADGLGHHRRIVRQAPSLLKRGGLVLLEISPMQAQAALRLTESSLWSPRLINDLADHARVLALRHKNSSAKSSLH